MVANKEEPGIRSTPWVAITPRTPNQPTPQRPAEAGIEKWVRKGYLGRGGYGEVWLVEYIGQVEAHKHLTKGTGDQRQRALREAFNARRIHHPNIIRVIDVNEDEGILRMEYVPGRDLARVVDEDGALPVERLLPLAVQTADALSAAHEQGIVHRDVKPSNLLLRENGTEIVVTDFGISGLLRAENVSGDTEPDGPSFVSPAMGSAGSNSARADIWALGVTLYYLATGGFPFPFEQVPVGTVARQPPEDPCVKWPHVPPEFWGLLARMLSDDPEQALSSMAAVRQTLDDYLRVIACPDCGNHAPLSAITDRCPAVACGKQGAGILKAAVLERRAAETALCEGRFEEAREGFTRAASTFGDVDADLARRMSALAVRTEEVRAEHDAAVAEIVKMLASERLVAAIRAVQQARRRFSRSAALLRLRVETRERMAALYTGLEARVSQDVKQRRFEEARDNVNRVDQILGDPVARRELERVLGRPAESLGHLYQRVEKKGNDYLTNSLKAKEHIERFRFAEASEVYTRLETEFPDPEHLEMIRRLSQAKESFQHAGSVADDDLRGLVTEPQRIAQAELVPLAGIRGACESLVSLFPVERYGSFARFQATAELAQQAARTVTEYVRARQAESAELGKKQRFGAERRVLELALGVVQRTDVFEDALRNALQARSKELAAVLERAAQRLAEGKAALERNEFTRAVALLEEVAAIAPAEFPDLGQAQERALEGKNQLSNAGEDFARGLAEIEGGRFTLESAQETLRLGEGLLALSDAGLREQNLKKLSIAVWRLVSSQSRHLDPQATVDALAPAEFLGQNFVPLAQAVPAARWPELLAESSDLRGELCALFQHAAARAVGEPAERFATLESLGEILRQLACASRPCVPPRLAAHPAVALVQTAAAAAGAVGKKNRPAALQRALVICEGVRATCAPEAERDFQRVVDALEFQLRSLRYIATLLRLRGSPGVAWTTAAGIAVLAVVIWFARERAGRNEVLETVRGITSWLEVLMEIESGKQLIDYDHFSTDAEKEQARKMVAAKLEVFAKSKFEKAERALSSPDTGSLIHSLVVDFKDLDKAFPGGKQWTSSLPEVLKSLNDSWISNGALTWSAADEILKEHAGQFEDSEVATALTRFAEAEFRRQCFVRLLRDCEDMARVDDVEKADGAAKTFLEGMDKTFRELQSLPEPLAPFGSNGKPSNLPEASPTVRDALIEAINEVVPRIS